MDIDQAEAILRVERGSEVANMSSKEIRRDLYIFAKGNPPLFLELANDENVHLRNVAIKATEAGIISLSSDNKGERLESKGSQDWSESFVQMMGLEESEDMLKMMQLYLMLHCDHEGGNVSTFSALTVNSALSDPYYSLSAGLNGLAGPLHGLANQNNLKLRIKNSNREIWNTSDKDLKDVIEWDKQRPLAIYVDEFMNPMLPSGIDVQKSDAKTVFDVVTKLFNIIPDVLKEHGKAKNPWPNVDAASGSLLHYYGLKEFEFYTVLFSMSRSLGIVSQMVLGRAMGLPLTRPKSLTFEALNKL